MKRLFRFFIFIFSFFIAVHSADAQTKRQVLEQKRQALQKEVNQINKLLSSNKKEKQSIVTKAEDLDRKIKVTESLIRTNNEEANLLTREINDNQNKISMLQKELAELKEDYARMIRQTYKSRSKQSRLMFLFSSESFLQAYKRVQYLKQYSKYRKKQGEKIKAKSKELEDLNEELLAQKKDKEKLLVQNKATKDKLQVDKKELQTLIAEANKKGSKYRKEIEQRQKSIAEINAEIKKIIAAAIARENKKKGSKSSSEFKLTPEAKALAKSFESNKGKLPWPLKQGNVVMGFGKQKSSLVSSIPIQSNGIRIQTNENEPVKAVFDGQVLQIQVVRGSNKAVFIQHGNYITLYSNLSQIDVHRGDAVITGQIIGKVGVSVTNGRPILRFGIYKNVTPLNPLLWILKR